MGINLLMGNLKRFRLKKLFKKIFGSRNDRLLTDYSKIVEEINLFEDQLKELSDEAILAKTEELKSSMQSIMI